MALAYDMSSLPAIMFRLRRVFGGILTETTSHGVRGNTSGDNTVSELW